MSDERRRENILAACFLIIIEFFLRYSVYGAILNMTLLFTAFFQQIWLLLEKRYGYACLRIQMDKPAR